MGHPGRKVYWDTIYAQKNTREVGWFQSNPKVSLAFIYRSVKSTKDKIIDIGGGDSLLVDHLIHEGFEDITVLDVSRKAIQKARERLGTKGSHVKWIVCDVVDLDDRVQFSCWHDRAMFHFLITDEDIARYKTRAAECILPGGHLILGTFSKSGPKTCSGLEIRQYSQSELNGIFGDSFEMIDSMHTDHFTPSGNKQNFLYCLFVRKGGD